MGGLVAWSRCSIDDMRIGLGGRVENKCRKTRRLVLEDDFSVEKQRGVLESDSWCKRE
jgi:hypothetical protein